MNHEVSATPIMVAVLFHSGFGHTARQAEAVRRGIERVAGAFALYLTSDEAQGRWDDRVCKFEIIPAALSLV